MNSRYVLLIMKQHLCRTTHRYHLMEMIIFRAYKGVVCHCAAFDQVWGVQVFSLNVIILEGDQQGRPMSFLLAEFVVQAKFARTDLAVH